MFISSAVSATVERGVDLTGSQNRSSTEKQIEYVGCKLIRSDHEAGHVASLERVKGHRHEHAKDMDLEIEMEMDIARYL